MRNLARYALNIGAAALFAGCGGSQSPIIVPSVTPQSHAIATYPDWRGSWTLPEAKSGDLLYISAGNSVYLFSYPAAKPVGVLTGFLAPSGLCSDEAGDVFVTNSATAQIFEFRHGATKPIKTLIDPHGNPYGCSIDPASGNLAVVNYCTIVKPSGCGGPGSVAVYPDGKGPATIYKDDGYYLLYCGYDDAGNLFVDGYRRTNRASIHFAELKKGGSAIEKVSLPKLITSYGAIQWDGRYLAVGNGFSRIYRLRVSRSKGNIVGSTHLQRAGHGVYQFWIRGRTLVGPNDGVSRIRFWRYPAGGRPSHSSNDLPPSVVPFGSTVSPRA